MYISIGNGYGVEANDIIGVFDLDNTTISKRGRQFLTMADRQNNIVYATEELPKSYIIIKNRHKHTIFISNLSSRVILKRVNEGDYIGKN